MDYAESYKNSQQNEIQSAYFGNSTFSIFTACCYSRSPDGSLKKDSIVVISESKDHDRKASLTCVKKVVEEAERINDAKFVKIMVWSDGCAAQFRSRFVFRLLTEDFFDGLEFDWFYNEKSHGKGPMDGVGGCVKNVIFRKVKSGFLTIKSPFEFHEAVLKYVKGIVSIYISDDDVLNEPENIEHEAKAIENTLKIHRVQRFQINGVYALKFFYLAEDVKPFFTQWYPNGKDVLICGHDISDDADDNHCAACLGKYEVNEEWIQCPALCKQWYHEQ